MRRAGRLAALTHDLTHRGVSAWALSSVLLGFYFGLYLTAETKQLLWALGVATPAAPNRSKHAACGFTTPTCGLHTSSTTRQNSEIASAGW